MAKQTATISTRTGESGGQMLTDPQGRRTGQLETVAEVGIAGAVLTTAGALWIAPAPLRPLLGVLGLLLAGCLGLVWWRGTWLLERYRRSQAIGAGPELIAFAIVHLRLSPTLEGAVDFAADAVGGHLGASLERHGRGEPTGRLALERFAAEWADLDPSLERAASLLGAAVEAPVEERPESLEKALDAVLEGSRDRVARFGAEIKGPATGIYAFGVMLPLALVGMLPVVATTGGGVSMLLLAAVYDLLIPAGLLLASLWLATKRPAIAGQSFERAILDHSAGFARSAALGLLAATGAAVLASLVFPQWSIGIAALGVGAGAGLVFGLSPVRERQAYIETLEEGLPDALSLAGRAIAEGSPVEGTIGRVGRRLAGPTGSLFERATRRRDRLGTTVQGAFFGRTGVLADVASNRADTAIELLVAAGTHGAPAGPTLQTVGEYLDSLQQVEREGRRELAQTTSTLRQTAMVFAPSIAGATVAMATGMDTVDAPGQAIDVSVLGAVVGVYVLLLGIILPTLSVVLERGFDPVRIGYRCGVALLVGALLYPFAFLATGTLV